MVAPWTYVRKRKAVLLYLSGKTLVEICSAMKAGSGTVQRYLREAGVDLRPPRKRPWTAAKVAECVRLYESGHSIAEVCTALGAGSDMVGRILHANGAQLRHFWTEDKVDQLVEAYQAGATIAQCYTAFQTNKSTVKRHLRSRGVTIRPYEPHRRENHGNWKGGRVCSPGNYTYVKAPESHPRYPGYIPEHRLVMEQSLGRYLTQEEVVHHKNKKRDDNRLDNLQLFANNAEHLAFELKGQVPKWTEDGKARIARGVQKAAELRRTARRSRSGDRS